MDRYTDGIVTKPINVADLSRLLNRSQENIDIVEYSNLLTSVGGLCKHPNINKWAKYKPIVYRGLGPLTDTNRTSNVENGELYGVKITGGNRLSLLHNVKFEYTKPTGGAESPYRLSDFLNNGKEGYFHKAKPEVYGVVNWVEELKICADVKDSIVLSIKTQESDELSISLNDIFPGDDKIEDRYPVVVIGQWATVMRTKTGVDGEEYVISPIGSEGTFYADLLTNPPSAEMGRIDFPTESNDPWTVSFGLVDAYKSKSESGYDLSNWTFLGEAGDHVIDNKALGLPSDPAMHDYDLCGMDVTLFSEIAAMRVNLGVFGIDDEGFSVSIVPASDMFQGVVNCTLEATFGLTSHQHDDLVTVSKPEEGGINNLIVRRFLWSDMGLGLEPPTEGEIVVSLTTVDLKVVGYARQKFAR